MRNKTVFKPKIKIRTRTAEPTRKVKAAGLGGLLAIVAQWGLGKAGLHLPVELLGPVMEQVVGAIGGPLFTLLSALITGYLARPSEDDQVMQEAG